MDLFRSIIIATIFVGMIASLVSGKYRKVLVTPDGNKDEDVVYTYVYHKWKKHKFNYNYINELIYWYCYVTFKNKWRPAIVTVLSLFIDVTKVTGSLIGIGLGALVAIAMITIFIYVFFNLAFMGLGIVAIIFGFE